MILRLIYLLIYLHDLFIDLLIYAFLISQNTVYFNKDVLETENIVTKKKLAHNSQLLSFK